MIPLVRPEIPSSKEIEKYFGKSRRSGAVSNFGPCYKLLVQRLWDQIKRHCLPTSTGTSAIQLAVQAIFPRGSRILFPDYTHIGTLQAVVAAGCVPILAPVNRKTWALDTSFANIVHPNQYDGFIVVSPFGYYVDQESYDGISSSLCKPVIYDFAGAWGTELTTVNPVCFSLHATKTFSCGEGGIIAFSREEHFEAARKLSNFDTNLDRSIGSVYGGNHKPDELKCAIALAHLDRPDRLQRRVSRRRRLIDIYQEYLGQSCIPHRLHINGAPSLCVVSGLNATKVEEVSSSTGIMMKQYYPLLTEMPVMAEIKRVGASSPFFRTCVALPSDVTAEQAREIALLIR